MAVRLPWQPEIEAGRTAAAHYERSLTQWRSQVRLILLVPALVVVPGAVPLWLFAPHGEFFAGLWIGVVAGMLMWIWDDPPEYIARWKRGAEGERETWKALRSLMGDGWRGFHDREGEFGNIDHIVVGSGGVFLLDTKNLSGTVVYERDGL